LHDNVDVGYDLHISRATFWPYSSYYPILEQEVIDLIDREADLRLEPNQNGGVSRWITWHDTPADAEESEGEWLQFWRGEIMRKWPSDDMIRRMAGLARSLDAWLTGDDCELYAVNSDGRIASRQRTTEEMHPGFGVHPHRFIVRAGGRYLWESTNPIRHEEWLEVAARQPDFRVTPYVEALLPSGWKTIECPPIAQWVGHPSGKAVPFFQDEYGCVEVHHADPATVSRMTELAPLLGAAVRDDD